MSFKTQDQPPSPPQQKPWESVFGGALGAWLGLALIKFGNPVILDQRVKVPADLTEIILLPWPVAWGYGLLGLVLLLSVPIWRWRITIPRQIILLPLAWMAWAGLSALGAFRTSNMSSQNEVRMLVEITILHFASCVACFYLSLFALSRVGRMQLFWTALGAGFATVLAVGWNQHFGGLEETRRYFYELPNWRDYPPEFIKKVSSNRIYSTLFYPNTLASVLIVLLPVVGAITWDLGQRWPDGLRWVLVGLTTSAGLACLFWSESKGGWLILLIMAMVWFMHLPIGPALRWSVLVLGLVIGLTGFFVRYSRYFERGAPSVSARFDYWTAAVTLAREHPLLGSGPGTFHVGYKRLKPPQAESARLVHNDFLEQASDSGLPGFALYIGLIWGSLALLYRRSRPGKEWVRFAVWLGCAGLAAQSIVEFPLYVPAVSWILFVFLGWLWGTNTAATCHNSNRQAEGGSIISGDA